uniref:Putative ovule protein n=1 Tax=Solanum chacoense TaxID=4108 RepID=A0A0V0GSD4_SOLCH
MKLPSVFNLFIPMTGLIQWTCFQRGTGLRSSMTSQSLSQLKSTSSCGKESLKTALIIHKV